MTMKVAYFPSTVEATLTMNDIKCGYTGIYAIGIPALNPILLRSMFELNPNNPSVMAVMIAVMFLLLV